MQAGDKVCFVVGTQVAVLQNKDHLNIEVGDIGVVEQVLPFHEPCPAELKGQSFAVVRFQYDTGYRMCTASLGIDIRQLRKVEL